MKKLLVIGLLLITLSLTVTILFLNRADHHGEISELGKDNFSLFPLKIDPEAEYDAPSIHFDNNTKVSGEVSKVDDLKNGQEVKVWLGSKEGAKVAERIRVINEANSKSLNSGG